MLRQQMLARLQAVELANVLGAMAPQRPSQYQRISPDRMLDQLGVKL